MSLYLGRKAVAEALKDALQVVHSKTTVSEKPDHSFIFREINDGVNSHDIFEAVIIVSASGFSDTTINITPINISLVDLRKLADKFFETNGDCSINVP